MYRKIKINRHKQQGLNEFQKLLEKVTIHKVNQRSSRDEICSISFIRLFNQNCSNFHKEESYIYLLIVLLIKVL